MPTGVELAIPSGISIVETQQKENSDFLQTTARILTEAGIDWNAPPEYRPQFPNRSDDPFPRGLIFEQDGEFADALTPSGQIVTLKKNWGTDGWGIAGI